MPAEPRRGPEGALRQPAGAGSPAPANGARPEPSPRAEPHLHLVVPSRRPHFNRRYMALWAGLSVVAGLALALVVLHVLIAQAQFRLDRLQQQAGQDQAQYEKLRLSVAQLESPARIVSIAEGVLGMQQPGSVTYLPAPQGAGSGASAGLSSNGPSFGSPLTAHGPTVTAPPGAADWPSVKPYLSGNP